MSNNDNDIINDVTGGVEVREAQPEYNKQYTYSNYLNWSDENRWELINGIAYMMSAQNLRHQEVLGNLFNHFHNYLKNKTCKVYTAPLDVRLNADTLDDTVVQPDLVVVCDHSVLDDAGIKGVPDMVIEVLSPSTARYDRTLKFKTYLSAGIREYWIVDPTNETLAVHILSQGNYIAHAYTDEDIVPVHVLEGCTINLSEVF